MAAGLPQIFTGMTISDTGGTSNAVTYTLNPVDAREIVSELVEDVVDAGDTIIQMLNENVSIVTYDDAIFSDTRCQVGSTIPSTRARVVLVAASGALTITVNNVLPRVQRIFDRDRVGYQLKFSKTATTTIFGLS